VGITGWLSWSVSAPSLVSSQGRAAWHQPARSVESGLLCQFPGQQVQNGLLRPFGVMAAANPRAGLLKQNGEGCQPDWARLVVDFDAIEPGIGPIRLAGAHNAVDRTRPSRISCSWHVVLEQSPAPASSF